MPSRPLPPVYLIWSALILFCTSCQNTTKEKEEIEVTIATPLIAVHDSLDHTISIFRSGEDKALVTQHARPDFRPYLHPIIAPDGKGELTEYSPGHHKHQTGLYWGFTRVNGRDYFHHPEGTYWKRIGLTVIDSVGTKVKWSTQYHLLDEEGEPVLAETQIWTMEEIEQRYVLNLEWRGEAVVDVTIGEYDYGGLFLRMPWKEGINGEVINAARQRNEKAEGQRAMWVDVGMQVEGREDLAHIAIFDHPDNKDFPLPWRVDGQLGVGPVRARLGDWTIPKGTIEVIRHQLQVYTGKLNNLELTGHWSDYSGKEATYATASLWGLAQKEGHSARFLDPQEAVAAMSVKPGYQVDAWAAEPMITQPMAFCWDDKGRLWVAENRDYESRGSGFSNSGDSRIVILEDTDRDGKADSRKVFLEGIPFPSGIAVGFDGLFLGAPPNLLFVPDKDRDDRADMEDIEVRLTGWGIRDRHETINSLHWGPDGWLYGLEGFATPSKIRKPKDQGKLYAHKEPFPEDLLQAEGVDINGGVWRYHPLKDRFEVVAHGFSNPWGIDYDAKGQLFISACVIPHLFHVVPGGIYHRQGGKHFNPYVYSDIRTIVDHRHRSAHGGARVYQSDAFPTDQMGRIFMANIHEHAVLSDVLKPKGSGFVASHGEELLLANNAQWIGFSLEIGPDGALYVLDWHDADICGKEVAHKETGRIFRLSPTESLAEEWEGRYQDVAALSDLALVELQTSPSDWHSRRARIILQGRAAQKGIDPAAIARAKSILEESSNQDHRLKVLWALHLMRGLGNADLLSTMQDEDEHIRAWAIQMLCEDGSPPNDALAVFQELAREDPSPVVSLYLTAALQRIEHEDRWGIAEALVQRARDAQDHNIPKMIWYGIEALVSVNPTRALELAKKSQIPFVAECIARRLVDAGAAEQVIAKLQVKSAGREPMLKGLSAALEGQASISPPDNWEKVYKKLKRNKRLAPQALAVAQQFGDAEAAKQFMETIQTKMASREQRIQALQALATKQWEPLADLLPGLLDDPALRAEAIKAIANFEQKELGNLLIDRYTDFNTADQQLAIQTLSARSLYGQLLTKALQSERIAKKDIPAYAARQLRRVVGNGFVEFWGPIDQLEGDKAATYQRYQTLLSDAAIAEADPTHGRLLFTTTCGACHKMYEEGGEIGPDLTGSNRSNLAYILSNMIYPNEEIQDDYKMVILTTRDGRTYMGNVVAENDRQLTLRVVGQEPVNISQSNIQTREVSNASLMPEGLLQTLSDQEVLDLVAYLKTESQVPMPSTTDD